MADNSLKKGRYTKYSNKIGLYDNSKGSFLKNDTEVVLNFPFKDAVLEAGMSKEEVGREERFLHLEIDSKDIDTLEEPKVLTDFSYVDKDGEKSLIADSNIEFFDENGELKQNLLIKGNNLLALYTLKVRLAGKVKLIYIDPPYNTGGDGFRYNDKFNHSAWLVFMKNRLEAARELLSDDGSIWITVDDNESHYLKVLCDEVFGRDCFVADIIWRTSDNSNNNVTQFSLDHNNIFVYGKNPEWTPNFLDDPSKRKHFKNPDNDPRGPWFDGNPVNNPALRPTLQFNITSPSGHVIGYPPNGWRWSEKTIEEKLLTGELRFSTDGKRLIRRTYLADMDKGLPPSTLWTDMESTGHNRQSKYEMKNLFPDIPVTSLFGTPKPEKLLKRVIEVASSENDIVLDFCLGSGTTSAVAHKMHRRWIGIEQMDYIEEVAKERLKKVVAGEQGGISNHVRWSGGGSFVYLELKKYNQEYIERIMEATSLKELEDIYVDMRNNAFLKFWFDRSHFEKDEDFRQLDIDGRKEALADVLDENQLYLNYADMGDTRHKVTADEKTLTDRFYGSHEN